jgi:hypothetical protein
MWIADNMQVIINADKLMSDDLPIYCNNAYSKEYADDQLAGFTFENGYYSRKVYRRKSFPYNLPAPESV